MYDLAFLGGLSLLAIGGVLLMVTRGRRGLPQAEVDRRFHDIVARLRD
jgi:hypothetical protein